MRSARAELLNDPYDHAYRFAITQDHAIAVAVYVHVGVGKRNCQRGIIERRHCPGLAGRRQPIRPLNPDAQFLGFALHPFLSFIRRAALAGSGRAARGSSRHECCLELLLTRLDAGQKSVVAE